MDLPNNKQYQGMGSIKIGAKQDRVLDAAVAGVQCWMHQMVRPTH